jgi:hypothetical protein
MPGGSSQCQIVRDAFDEPRLEMTSVAAPPLNSSRHRFAGGLRAQVGRDLRHGAFRYRVGGDVRGDDDARVPPEGMRLRQGFFGEYVEQRKAQASPSGGFHAAM